MSERQHRDPDVVAPSVGAAVSLPYCLGCRRHFYYPRPRCPFCWGDALADRIPRTAFRVRSFAWVIRPQEVRFERRVPILLLTAASEDVSVIAEGVGWTSNSPPEVGEEVDFRRGQTPEGREAPLFVRSRPEA
ncbi:MAG: zinc ribbon domain-containing protein [Gaiellaceae bacterium]